MCGLVAVFSRGRPIDADRMRRALGAIAHRGPDGLNMETTVLQAAAAGQRRDVHAALGHARLAILDPQPRSDQPFTHDAATLVYNGEIYNFRDLAQRMRAAGTVISTSGDTEVMAKLLARDGPEGLAAVNGMWALCWLDRHNRRVIAARDRYGKKPLFYTVHGDTICFASEIKALIALTGAAAKPLPSAIAGFIAEGWLFPDADGSTHLEGIREVRPGHLLEVDLETWTISEQLNVAIETADTSAELSDDALAALLEESVRLRLVSDRRVGLLLSGGVDSSLILSILAARGLADQVTFITGEAGKSEDAAYARRALDRTGRPALTVPLDYGPASFEPFLDVCRHQEKPFPLIGNVLGMPALYQAAAADGIRVVLDGTGADEVFAGYWLRQAAFAMRDAARAGDHGWLADVRAGGQLSAALANLDDRALIGDRLPEPARHGLSELELSFLGASGRAGVAATWSTDPLLGFQGSLQEALALDATAGRMQEWLWQNDRNAMSAGIENRSPFLDHRLARWMSTGYHAKLAGPWNKQELRRMFDRFTPLPTATRADKQGFRWVYGRFMRSNRERIIELVAGSGLARDYLDGTRLLDQARSNDAILELDLLQRLMVIAGLEAVGLLAAG
jgi:asparagine synthase (glutamine-hydrolysing)